MRTLTGAEIGDPVDADLARVVWSLPG